MAALLAACSGGGSATATPFFTPRPTATATPRSTELPLVPTQLIPGTAAQPLRIGIIAQPEPARNRLLTALSEGVSDELANFRLGFIDDGLKVEFVLLESRQEALQFLCNGVDTAVFVDALTFYAAEKQCGAKPALQIVQDGATGTTFDLVVFRQRVFVLGAINTFCVLDPYGMTSFIHPALAFRAAGVDPLTDFDIVTGFEDEVAMVLALQGRYERGSIPACDAAALPVGMLAEIEEELVNNEDRDQRLTVNQFRQVAVFEPDVTQQWEPIPHDILVFPPDRLFAPHLRAEIVTALLNIQGDGDTLQSNLQSLIPHDELRPVQYDAAGVYTEYDAFRAWMDKTGWDMAASALN